MLPETDETKRKLARLAELKQKEQAENSKHLALARKYYPYFAERVLKDEASGNFIKLAKVHLKWLEHINWAWSHGLHAVILAPFAHGKSVTFGIGMPLFAFGLDPSLRIIVISANDRIARKRLMSVRDYIDNSQEYHEVFPNVKANLDLGWSKSELFLQRPTMAKDPSLLATGITASIQGSRADILIVDDANDARNTIHQPRMRDVVWGMYTGPFMSRLVAGGKIVIIATRFHAEDLVGKILEDDDMRQRYAFLIQRISSNFDSIECETIIPSELPKSHSSHRAQLDRLYQLSENGVF